MLGNIFTTENIFTTKEAAPLLNRTPRHVAGICAKGEFAGAIKKGKTWLIPEMSLRIYIATHPIKGRKKTEEANANVNNVMQAQCEVQAQ